MASSPRLDPIRFEVIRNALMEATEEMSVSLRRSAYSTNIKTRNDFSCALFDCRLRAVAQAFNQPNHLGSLVHSVPSVVRAYGPDRLGPGDTLIANHPYQGGVHLNDITFISPLFHRDRLFGYVANLAHHVDVGGGAPASVGAFQEVFQEGVIIPPVKVVENGELVEDVFRLVLAQIRSKHETGGDFRAQVAANHTGIRRLAALIERLGLETITDYTEELFDYTERRTRAEVAKLPQGEFSAEGVVDSDGFTDRPVRLVARVHFEGTREVRFDFTGSDPQRRAPVNSTYAQTYSACAYVLKSLIDPDLPVNHGFYRLLQMVAPAGSVVHCKPPAPVVGGWEVQTRLVDVMFKALAPALPGKIPAGSKAMQCHAGFGGIHPVTGDYYCFLETLGGGYGARVAKDGPDAVQTHGQNTENAPIEETESNYPVRILRYELVNDSEGAGTCRGGLGLRRDYLFADHEVSFTILADRERWGPHGLFGGLPGLRSSYLLNPGSPGAEVGSKLTLQLKPGEIVSYRTCGGGGYGPPHHRSPQAVLQDVREGKVSAERARSVYGVGVDTALWRVDEAETRRLRRKSGAAGPA